MKPSYQLVAVDALARAAELRRYGAKCNVTAVDPN
jgi:hypothetical protein